MARGRKTTVESREQLIRTKDAYDNAVETLQKILDIG